MLNVFMLSVIMLSVIMLSVIMLSVFKVLERLSRENNFILLGPFVSNKENVVLWIRSQISFWL